MQGHRAAGRCLAAIACLFLAVGGCCTPESSCFVDNCAVPDSRPLRDARRESLATVGPLETQQPTLAFASHTQEPPAPVAEPEPVAAVDLEDGDELTLAEVINLAIAANPDTTAAVEQLAIADATLARARAEFYPKLGISEQYGVTNNPVAAFSFQLNQGRLSLAQDFNNPRTIDDFHTQLRLEHRVYAGEQRRHGLHAAQAGVSAAAWNLESVHNQLVFRVAEAYYRLLQARDLVKVRQQAVQQVSQHLDIVQSRFRNETAVKSDVLTVEVRLAEVREALISAENQLQLAWAVLHNVTGTAVSPRPLPEAIPTAPWNQHVAMVQAAVDDALNSRPEIGALANQRQAATEGVLVAQAGKGLSVDLVTDYDVYTGDFGRGNDSFFAGVIFQLNLLDGGRTSSEVSRALARVREIAAREQRLILDIELDVRRAHLQLNDAEERLKVATQAIGQAQESLREIEVRYRGQTATITQLVDAQVALSNALVRRTNSEADVQIARASLERAIGRLSGALQ
ncbi:MAG: TolC family protein [Planctomycetes bacterium]|nr:TolC family protein [Planctomycetota bacterium]